MCENMPTRNSIVPTGLISSRSGIVMRATTHRRVQAHTVCFGARGDQEARRHSRRMAISPSKGPGKSSQAIRLCRLCH